MLAKQNPHYNELYEGSSGYASPYTQMQTLWSTTIIVNALLVTTSTAAFLVGAQFLFSAPTALEECSDPLPKGTWAEFWHRLNSKTWPTKVQHSVFGLIWCLTSFANMMALSVSVVWLGELLRRRSAHDVACFIHQQWWGVPKYQGPTITTIIGLLCFLLALCISAAMLFGRCMGLLAAALSIVQVVVIVATVLQTGSDESAPFAY